MTTKNTKRNLKPFEDLTEGGKTRRLNMYEQERIERGTEQVLARVAIPVKIKEIKNGAKLAVVRVAIYDKETDSTRFQTMTAYIAPDKDALEKFYATLEVGQLASIEFKQNENYFNIYNLMLRDTKKQKAKELEV